MALFSTKKSKAKKAEKAAKAEQQKALEAKPAAAPFKHTLSNAATDSQTHRSGDQEGNQLQRVHTESSLGNTSRPQATAQNAMHDRPMPSKSVRSSSTVKTTTRSTSGYFTPTTHQPPSFDSPILGNPKMQAAARDRGYISPHHSADSGYGSVGTPSAAQSRAPSTHRSLYDQPPPMLRQPTNFLPELTLGQELAQDPAFSEHSYAEEEQQDAPRVEQPKSSRRRNEEAYSERSESGTDKESVKSSRSSRSRKHTRFEEAVEPVPPIPQQQQRSQPSVQQAAIASRDWQEQPAQHQQPEPPLQYAAPVEQEAESHLARQNQVVSPIAGHRYEEMSPYGNSEQPSFQERGRDTQQYYSHPAYGAASGYQTPRSLSQQPSQARQRSSSIPPVSILNGLKVNKRGRILDEEGDSIGELYDGDIMDCVRQKANEYGEVLDEYGGVVGRVRTIARDAQSIQRSSMSSRPGENEYFQRNFQLPSQIASGHPQSRRQSLQQPTQRQEHLHQAAPLPPNEPASSVTNMQPASRRPSVAPLDMPKSEGALELDASQPSQPVDYEPVFDCSEPFMPPPHVPAKSPRRSESPSPVREGAERDSSEDASSGCERNSDQNRSRASELPAGQPMRATEHESGHPEHPASMAPRTSTEPAEDNDATPRASPSYERPRSQAQPQLEPQTQQARPLTSRPLARATSERQQSFTRPPIPPVPENLPAGKSPTLFSYKGDIPTTDGPPPGLGAARVKSPPLPSFPRQAFAAGAAGGSPFAGTGMVSAPPMLSRRISGNGVPMSGASSMGAQRPGMKSRYSTNTPLVRSPLSSHETTPPESDEGSSEGADRDQVGAMGYAKFRAHSRAPSVRTMSSITSTGKPRTYFTHAGRVTVDAGELPPSAVAAQTAAKTASNPLADEKKEKEPKKKNRMSLFGKKK